MKVIIAGSRGITDIKLVEEAIRDSGFEITEVVSGCARGVDSLGESWAATHGISVKKFPAKWEENGKKAGYLRNIEMAKYADALIAIWADSSPGTKHMIKAAQDRSLKVHVRSII